MGKIEDRFHKDALWAKLKNLREAINEVDTPEGDDARDALHYVHRHNGSLPRSPGGHTGERCHPEHALNSCAGS